MAQIPFSEVETWMDREGIGPAEAARRFKVSTQTFNGWKLRQQVSYKASDHVATVIRSFRTADPDGPYPLMRSEHHYIPLFDVRASMGFGAHQPDHIEVVRHIAVSLPDLRRQASFSAPTNLSFITGYGNSMEPTFSDGDVLLVDEGVEQVKYDAVYVLERNRELFIKRIQRRPDGGWLMISDNKLYEPQVITLADLEAGTFNVRGRVVLAWNARKL